MKEEYQIQEEIRHTIDRHNGMLYVRSFKFYIIPKVKFVRAKDKKVFISDTRIGTYKIDVPFTIKREIRTTYHDYTKFHCDWEEKTTEVEVKEYKEPEFTNFINDKLLIHLTLNNNK